MSHTQSKPASRSAFNFTPLQEVFREENPADIARSLDEIIEDLTLFYIDHVGSHSGSVTNLHYLKRLRNATMKGADIFDFEANYKG